MNFKAIASKIQRSLCLGLVMAVAFASLLLSPSAIAAGSQKAADVVQRRAEREVDRVQGSGTANQLKGQAEETLGRAQRQFGDEVEGSARQVRGKARKEFGRAQEATEDVAQDAQESAEGLADRVKDFFGQ